MKNKINCNHSHHQCFCSFIPIHVLENLVRSGHNEIITSIQSSKITRRKRNQRVHDMNEFASLDSGEKAARMVYDSQNSWNQRVKLVLKEGGSGMNDKSVKNAYDFAGMVRDYFKQKYNRNSIDNAKMDLILNVHYGKKYDNAFWDGDEMTFGDGDGEIFTDFSKSLDVVAHELAHGVTQWESDLAYEAQPGALNEHFSDVFGSVITQHVEKKTADNADWLIGDEIMGPKLKGEALRSMSEPGTAYDNDLMGKDDQPSHMRDYYHGSGDNYGVHINSGILNKAFYLTAKEIGTETAGLIWYTTYQKLWPTAQFNDAVKAIVKSATELVNINKAPKGSPQKIRAAFKEVGLPQ